MTKSWVDRCCVVVGGAGEWVLLQWTLGKSSIEPALLPGQRLPALSVSPYGRQAGLT